MLIQPVDNKKKHKFDIAVELSLRKGLNFIKESREGPELRERERSESSGTSRASGLALARSGAPRLPLERRTKPTRSSYVWVGGATVKPLGVDAPSRIGPSTTSFRHRLSSHSWQPEILDSLYRNCFQHT